MNYSVYDITSECEASLDAAAVSDAKVEIACGDVVKVIEIKAGAEVANYPLLTLKCGGKYTISLKALDGIARFEKLYFPA